jgi:hypothetical protein
VLRTQITLQGMPTLSTSQLEVRYFCTGLRKGQSRGVVGILLERSKNRAIYVCLNCSVALCVMPCFKIHHMHSKF